MGDTSQEPSSSRATGIKGDNERHKSGRGREGEFRG